MLTEQFATVSWDFQDVEYVASEEVTREEAEQFLADNEEKIKSFLNRVGTDFLAQLWNEQHPED